MKKPVKAETTVNPPLLRSGIQNACTYSDTGCVGGSICAADAVAYIPVNTDAKVSTTQKRAPCRVVFLCGGDNWNYHPLFTAFRVLSAPVKKTHIYAGFLVFSFLCIQTQNANFQKFRVRFVYEAVKTKLFLNGLFFAPNNLLHVAELSQIFACIINLQASSLESDTALVEKTKKKNNKIY